MGHFQLACTFSETNGDRLKRIVDVRIYSSRSGNRVVLSAEVADFTAQTNISEFEPRLRQ